MKRAPKRDLAASVKSRLLRLAKDRSEELQHVLVRYTIERLLYRLWCSPYADTFILKGAILASAWEGGGYRPTKDLDLLGHGSKSPEAVAEVFRQIAGTEVEPDGLAFDPATVAAEPILEEARYGGVRVHLIARLGKARIPLQVDVGFGDPVTPGPVSLDFPSMLDLPSPSLRAYPAETIVAEKYETLVRLGVRTSRIKDFYDLWYLAMHFSFQGELLRRAIANTFRARGTSLPSKLPFALTEEFGADRPKQALWKAFTKRSGITSPGDLAEALALLRTFLLPVGLENLLRLIVAWPPGGPWQEFPHPISGSSSEAGTASWT
ncbi:MAG: nucleotidyl transferase AbiEii/AbiGii toxin family protein [Chloroflexota bacterium]